MRKRLRRAYFFYSATGGRGRGGVNFGTCNCIYVHIGTWKARLEHAIKFRSLKFAHRKRRKVLGGRDYALASGVKGAYFRLIGKEIQSI